jgi:hypothetical protein
MLPGIAGGQGISASDLFLVRRLGIFRLGGPFKGLLFWGLWVTPSGFFFTETVTVLNFAWVPLSRKNQIRIFMGPFLNIPLGPILNFPTVSRTCLVTRTNQAQHSLAPSRISFCLP